MLIWPLGGLANVEVPHTPRANFLTAAAGPAVNLAAVRPRPACCSASCLGQPLQPLWNPLRWLPAAGSTPTAGIAVLSAWSGERPTRRDGRRLGRMLLTRLFWVNWMLLLLNIILIGFPLDGGRMLPGILWRCVGYRQATLCGRLRRLRRHVRRRPLRHRRTTRCCRCAWPSSSTSRASTSGSSWNRRRGVAVRLRLLAGLHQPGARPAAGRRRGAAAAELVAALAAAAGRPASCSASRSSARPKSAAWTNCWRRCSARAWPR